VLAVRRELSLAVALALACALAGPACAGAAVASSSVPRPAAASAAASAAGPARRAASLVDDIAPGSAGSDPADLTAMGGELYFSASNGTGRQLWKSDGTATGTVMLTDVSGGADPEDLTAADGELFFSATDPAHGRELWQSDGTTAGTTLISDIAAGAASSDPHDIAYAIGQQDNTTPAQVLVYFSASDGPDGYQLWRSDGTVAGTVMVTDVNPDPDAGLAPADISPLTGTTAMFSGDDGVHGREPWVTDGTSAGTQMYDDLNPGAASSDPAGITATVESLGLFGILRLWYFSANDAALGREFFAAPAGNPPPDPYDVNPGPASSDPGPYDAVAQQVGLFAANSPASRRELFAVQEPPVPSPGEPVPGTATAVAGVGPGAGSDPVLAPSVLIGSVAAPVIATRTYFAGDDAGHGRQLWQADEQVLLGIGESQQRSFTVTGVRLVDLINPGSAGAGSAGADPAGFVSVGGTPTVSATSGGTEVFSADDGAHGREVWTSDGWSTNTALAADINPGPAGSDPVDFTVIGQNVYFSANDGRHGRELWKLTVPPTPQIVLVSPGGSTVPTGTSETFTAVMQANSGEPDPAGRVTFYEDGNAIGTAPLTPQSSGGPAASVTSTAQPGTHQIVAVYQGDGTYTPTTSNTGALTGD
jgi:ELWxxDGT repeat protein